MVKTIPTPGPGFFICSHANSPYAWVDSAASPSAHDTLTVIDKTTLGVVAQVREPGRTLSHIAFTHDGRYVLVSLGEMDGALIVLDAKTFKEVKRIPIEPAAGHLHRVEQAQLFASHFTLAQVLKNQLPATG